jgi:hypothetical protein
MYPDFIQDREGLDRWRESSRTGDGHAMVANNNTVFRFVQTIDSLEKDAMRFRALMRCGRIKVWGSAGVDPNTLERREGTNVHFGAEFWPGPLPQDYREGHPEETARYDHHTAWGRLCIEALADAIIELEAKS